MQDLTLVIPAKHESESLPIFLKEINADGSMNPLYLSNMLKKVKNNRLDFLFASKYGWKPKTKLDDAITKTYKSFLEDNKIV